MNLEEEIRNLTSEQRAIYLEALACGADIEDALDAAHCLGVNR